MNNEKNAAPMWANFEDWEFVAQSGNFLVKSYEDEELRYYAVKTVAGHWAQVYRNDHPLFHIIESFLNTEDEKLGDILDMLVTLNYTMSSIAPDQQFVDEFTQSVFNLHARQDEFEKQNAEKSDAEILAEDEEAAEVEERFGEMVSENVE